MSKQEFFKAGYISRTHGLKGGVVVKFAQEPISEPNELFVEREDGSLEPLHVESWSTRPDLAFVTFVGVSQIDQAKALRGKAIYVPIEDTEGSTDGFHGEALIGYSVKDPSDNILGKVSRYSSEGGRQLLLVATAKGDIIIPADGPFLTKIHHRKKIIEVDLPDGFLDI